MNELDESTEALLKAGLARPPSEFRDNVMQNIAAFERQQIELDKKNQSAPIQSQLVPWWQWIALTAGGVVGIGQVLRFIFSVWFVTTAG